MGGGFDKSKSKSTQESFNRGFSFVDKAQQPFLQSLYSQAAGLADQQRGLIGPQAQQLRQNLLGAGGQGLQTLLNANSPQVQQQQLSALNQFSQQNLRGSLGQVDQNALGSGGFGGTAQGLAQGEAIGQSNTAFNLGASQILGQQQQLGLQGAQAGLQSLGGLFDLGLAPFSSQFQPLQQFAQLLGGPTVLNQQDAAGQGRSTSQAFGMRGGLFGGS